jgi:hypothetical protein
MAETCALCGKPLVGLRADARYCSPSHRIEASRRRRLSQGQNVDGYQTLDEYLGRRSRRTDGLSEQAEGRAATRPPGTSKPLTSDGGGAEA